MTTQFTPKKHQTAVLAAKQTETGLQRVASDASTATQTDLSSTVHCATERKDVVEGALESMKAAKAKSRASHTSLKFAMNAIIAYGLATGETSLTDAAAQRSSAADIAVGEVLLDQLGQLKGTMAQALTHFLTKQLESCRESDAHLAKTAEAVAKADLAWSTDYFRLISLTSLGISLQQAAGFEVVRTKSPPRGKAKKKVVAPPATPGPVVAPSGPNSGQAA